MIKSMTGFASVSRENEQVALTVTARAVNHRFLDLQLRLPQLAAPLESACRSAVQQRLARGRVELSLTLQLRRDPAVDVEVHEAVVAALADAFRRAAEKGLVEGALAPGDLLRVPQAVSIRERAVNGDAELPAEVRDLALAAVGAAIDELDEMRAREGRFLATDLEARRQALGPVLDQIERMADEGRAATEARLTRRVQDMQLDTGGDPGLMAQEIVRVAARSDVSEELVRFRAHLDHWRALADGPEPCGRKLDFLLQEMNREINTIGSKAEAVGLAERIVHVKAELEKLREQVQNVE
jgi:uncharacterized protein (TIGR00255 family)